MSQSLLDQLLISLYQNAFDRKSSFDLPFKLINEPIQAKLILDSYEIFHKNYDFVGNFSMGRFSANASDWRMRVPLTQPYFVNYTKTISEVQIEEIYLKNLSNFFASKTGSLFQALIDASIEVIFHILGLPIDTPWPYRLQVQMRDLLILQQAIAWGYGSQDQFMANEATLKLIKDELESLWRNSPEMSTFLGKIKQQSGSVAFDPVGEVIQLLQVSSEAISSMTLSMIYCLLNYKNQRLFLLEKNDKDSKIQFIKETLRLFPAVPVVTRICQQDIVLDGVTYKSGDAIVISILGLHCHPSYWNRPAEFNPQRLEFTQNTFDKKAYIPFLSGSRSCVGMRLANQELFIALKIMLECIEFADFNEPLKLGYGITSKPSNNLEHYLTLRKV